MTDGIQDLIRDFLLLAFRIGAIRPGGNVLEFGPSSTITAFTDLFLYPGELPHVKFCGWVYPMVEAVDRRRREGSLTDEAYEELMTSRWLTAMNEPVTEEMLTRGLPREAREELETEGSVSFMVEAAPRGEKMPIARGRVTLFRATGDILVDESGDRGRPRIGAVVRILPMYPPPYKLLLLPSRLSEKVLEGVARGEGGLYLFSGLMGAGKTTTIASLVAQVGDNFPIHVVVLEDYMEYVQRPSKAVLAHREIGRGKACPSYEKALDDLLRTAVNLVVVGEVRSKEVMEKALTLAETGVMVFCTIHAPSAPETFFRILGMFTGAGRREEILCRLGDTVKLVSHQALVSMDGSYERLVPVCQIFEMDGAVAQKMKEGDAKALSKAIDTRLAFYRGPNRVKAFNVSGPRPVQVS